MTDQLDFDSDTGARLDQLYVSADVQRRRKLATAALAPEPGDRLLDIGCGPGFHVSELAEAVGPDGVVVGTDRSEAMLGAAAHRNRERPNASFKVGEATDLPFDDATFDGAIAMQVYEYVDDVETALSEAFRVLRPGGRLVVVDVDWSTLSWYSSDPERMDRILEVWDDHLSDPALPRRLAAAIRDVGFVNVKVDGHVFVNTDDGPDSYSGLAVPLIADFVAGRGIDEGAIAAWKADLSDLSSSGRYFFSVTKFIFSATRPDP